MKKRSLKGKPAPRKRIPISFTSDISGFALQNSTAVKKWLNAIALARKRNIVQLSYTFISDEQLLKINRDFLRHNTYTDIITFDYSSDLVYKNDLAGEIYISIDRVTENAQKFNSTFKDELHRVMAHGLLHLCGLGDKSVSQSKRMRSAEENALDLRHF